MPFDHEPNLDGEMTLNETESTCENIQREGFQLADIHFDTITKNGKVFLVNKAGFEEKLFGRLDDLDFVEVNGKDPMDIKENKKNAGWTFICDSEVFDQKLTKRVLVFGKKS